MLLLYFVSVFISVFALLGTSCGCRADEDRVDNTAELQSVCNVANVDEFVSIGGKQRRDVRLI